jgi:hypothetical protein
MILTLASFEAASSNLVYGPSVPLLLGVRAIAQMGVHVVFFFHISSAPAFEDRERLLLLRVATICTVWVRLDEFPNRQRIGCFARRGRDMVGELALNPIGIRPHLNQPEQHFFTLGRQFVN